MIGTVVGGPHTGRYGDRVDVLWHQIGTKVGCYCDTLVLYVNPLDALGRSAGAHRTWAALNIVLGQEQPHAMEKMQRDLERARMTAEDLRTRSIEAN